LLKDRVSLDGIAEKVTRPLSGLKVASYYGCLLVRPAEIGIDDVENPTILEKLTAALGAEPIDFPHKTECCAAYQTLDKPEIVAERTYQIVNSARAQGAEVISVSCPLCAFNLDQRQEETAELYPDFKHMPVLYFTQLLAISLGCGREALRFDLHHIDPEPVLSEKGLL
jgi:heterodisulfide reductase subunit B